MDRCETNTTNALHDAIRLCGYETDICKSPKLLKNRSLADELEPAPSSARKIFFSVVSGNILQLCLCPAD